MGAIIEGKMKGAILLIRNEGCDCTEGKIKGAILLRRNDGCDLLREKMREN